MIKSHQGSISEEYSIQNRLKISFMDFDGNFIRYYDYYWQDIIDKPNWKANYVRGAKEITVWIDNPLTDEQKPIEIHLYEINWIMTVSIMYFFIMIASGHIILTLHLMYKAKLIFVQDSPINKNVEAFNPIKEDHNNKDVDDDKFKAFFSQKSIDLCNSLEKEES